MGDHRISKLERPIHPFERSEAWKTVESAEEEAAIYRAMDHPVRRTILKLLDEGPVRQMDLTRFINENTGRRYDAAAFLHHLGILERAGLVGHASLTDGKTRVKIVYRVKDVKLQVYTRPKVDVSKNVGG
jgi:predicted transcriptional regulator